MFRSTLVADFTASRDSLFGAFDVIRIGRCARAQEAQTSLALGVERGIFLVATALLMESGLALPDRLTVIMALVLVWVFRPFAAATCTLANSKELAPPARRLALRVSRQDVCLLSTEYAQFLSILRSDSRFLSPAPDMNGRLLHVNFTAALTDRSAHH